MKNLITLKTANVFPEELKEGKGKVFAVPFAYQRYGTLEVEAKTEAEAVAKAEDLLERMSVSEMEELTSYLQDSEEIDKDGYIVCYDRDRIEVSVKKAG